MYLPSLESGFLRFAECPSSECEPCSASVIGILLPPRVRGKDKKND
nr:MAG TPA: hypothetical protein [Caudoviricetes sp.]